MLFINSLSGRFLLKHKRERMRMRITMLTVEVDLMSAYWFVKVESSGCNLFVKWYAYGPRSAISGFESGFGKKETAVNGALRRKKGWMGEGGLLQNDDACSQGIVMMWRLSPPPPPHLWRRTCPYWPKEFLTFSFLLSNSFSRPKTQWLQEITDKNHLIEDLISVPWPQKQVQDIVTMQINDGVGEM